MAEETESIRITLSWTSGGAHHIDHRHFERASLAAGCLPGELMAQLAGLPQGGLARARFQPGQALPERDPSRVVEVPRGAWRAEAAAGLEPRAGRYYPRRLIAGLPGVTADDRRPMRCLEVAPESLLIDLNHPLSGRGLDVEVRRVHSAASVDARPAAPGDLLQAAAAGGPGMQAPLPMLPMAPLTMDAFTREDERDDELFYERARLVDHIDATAMERLRAIHARFLFGGIRVLDLMSSRTTHLPGDPRDFEVIGLGMNRIELEANDRLAGFDVHDLNRQPRLPYDSASFDAVLCALSVEYLTRPADVFREVARVLRPGGPFVLAFSERWFPPKVIRWWTELHPFERMGWVLDLLAGTAAFDRLGTESLRGLPRPAEDRYAGRLAHSDPIYAVWGYAAR